MRLSQLHAQMRDMGAVWSREQLRLLLEVFEGFQVEADKDDPDVRVGEATRDEKLLSAIRQILGVEPGRPIPIARVLELLPADLTASPEQLRSLAAKATDLEVRGALVRRKR
jgi:hypothetical protein